MTKPRKSDGSVATGEQTEATPPLPANGDAAPAKKPPRDKAESFKRVGNQRVAKAIYAMRRLLPLANRNAYIYTEDQANKVKDIVAMLADEVTAAFSTVETKNEPAPSIF